MAATNKAYEAIVWGATGYTGKYTCEHIVKGLPMDFKWALAGRSEDKLRSLANELKSTNPDRLQPSIEVAQLQKDDLVKLAKKTKVLISTVGPYHKYGEIVVEACAETGTHYLDVTGEVPDLKHQATAEPSKRTLPRCVSHDLPNALAATLKSNSSISIADAR